ncbi:hypothetical protein [Actinomyces procaprae]|uniref:hypothetical protein n=1 Tax=Actinomyces procaprae TaxID=2560010 RepID=UPI00109DDF27|nr:hypothetical protein [Actinomyces procaprae]
MTTVGSGGGALDLESVAADSGRVAPPPTVVIGQRSAMLWDVLFRAYQGLGEAVGGDEAFRQTVLARLVEPTSKDPVPL